jgi:Lrp/AsnC family transcriptional regulator for asnA, asnC and gidA
VVINKKKAGLDCYATIPCKVDPGKLDDVTRKLLRIENILQVYHTSGDRNMTFMIATCDYDEMKRILSEKVAPLGIRDMEIKIIMESVREMAYTDIM